MTPWTLIPWVNNVDMSIAAAEDALKQQGADPARVLIIGNGVSAADRMKMERFIDGSQRALGWFHDPPLPSLSATWNRALDFVWGVGEEVALVVNNDTRLAPDTFLTLHTILNDEDALLVTATGVEGEEGLFEEALKRGQNALAYDEEGRVRKGGPGFSCFLMSKAGHKKYRFDEMLTPAYCEDCDWHRRAMLAGDGDRVFGTNVRYLHLGGQTLLAMSPEQREATQHAISNGSRAHYQRKWGGGVNEEVHVAPFGPPLEPDGTVPEVPADLPTWIYDRKVTGESVKNPDLFNAIREKW